jgi:hypothetical protein
MSDIIRILILIVIISIQSCVFTKNIACEELYRIQINDSSKYLVLSYEAADEYCNDSVHYWSTCFVQDLKTDLFFEIHSECFKDTNIKVGDFVRIKPYTNSKPSKRYKNITSGILFSEHFKSTFSSLYWFVEGKIVNGAIIKTN